MSARLNTRRHCTTAVPLALQITSLCTTVCTGETDVTPVQISTLELMG